MFCSCFNIKYTNQVSKSGYLWNGDDIIPLIEGENISVDYSMQTFDDFKKLTQFYADTKSLKIEALKFLNLWGKLELNNNSKPEYLSLMNSIHIYESIKKDIELKKQPVFQEHHKTDFLNLSYEWDDKKKIIVPTFYPENLWNAIRLTFLFCGINGNENAC